MLVEKGNEAQIFKLRGEDFDDIQFIGEYPFAHFEYRKIDSQLPVKISSEVFLPFVPLSLRKLANPVTVLKYTITNTSMTKLDISLIGWIKNIDFLKEQKYSR